MKNLHKRYLLVLGSMLLLLGGCGDNVKIIIETDEVTFNFPTTKIYQEQIIHEDDQTPPYLIKQYEEMQENESGRIATGEYKDSLFIAKLEIDMPDKDKFMKNNINTAQVNGYDQEDTTFKCGTGEIEGTAILFTKQRLAQTIYFIQYFFVNDHNGYIISFSSEEEKERSQLKKGLKTLTCK